MSEPNQLDNEIHAVIGVWRDGPRTIYVKRSESMENYPGVWSLLSIQFHPGRELPNQFDMPAVQRVFDRLSNERLNGAPIKVDRYLTSGFCTDNPMQKMVLLHLYEISLADEPKLNPAFYESSASLLPHEYMKRAEGSACGLCLRLWSDYSYRNGLVSARFAPAPRTDDFDAA